MTSHCPLNSLPKDEREHFRTLSKEDAYVWVQAKRRQTRQAMYGLDSIHNLFSPVSRLPTELFLEVIRYVKAHGASGSFSWVKLAGVCRDWRETLLATPMLWATINITNHPSFVQLCLERSRNALITIRDEKRYSEFRTASVEALIPHIDRVLSLEATHLDHETMCLLISKLAVVMPHLERLSLTLRGPRIAFHAFSQNPFPRLRSLTLRNVQVPWSSPILVGLSELDLSLEKPGLPALPLESLLDILDASPHLTLLRMKGCEPTISAGDAPFTSSSRVVRLPELKVLKLAGKSAPVLCLFARLVLPLDTFIELCPSHELVEGFELSAHPILDIFLGGHTPRNLADVTHAELGVTFDNTVFFEAKVSNDTTQSMRLRIELKYPKFERLEDLFGLAMCDVTALLSASPLRCVGFFGSQDFLDEGHWHNALGRLTHVEELEIGGRGNVQSFWKTFRQPRDNGELYCPRLEKLSVDNIELHYDTADLVIECLQDRMLRGHRLKRLEYCFYVDLPRKMKHKVEMLVDTFHEEYS